MSDSVTDIQTATAQAAAVQAPAQASSAAQTFASVLAGFGGFSVLPGQLKLALPNGAAQPAPERAPLRNDEARDTADDAWDHKDAVRDRSSTDRPEMADHRRSGDKHAGRDDHDPSPHAPSRVRGDEPLQDEDRLGLESMGVVGPATTEAAPTIRLGQDNATNLMGAARQSTRPDAGSLPGSADTLPADDALAPLIGKFKNAQGGKDGGIKINLEDAGTNLTSRPMANLAASASVAAQANQTARAATTQTHLLDADAGLEADVTSAPKDPALAFVQNRTGNQGSANNTMTQGAPQQNTQTAEQTPTQVGPSFAQALAARSAATGPSQAGSIQATTASGSGEPTLSTTGAGNQVQTSQRPAAHAAAVRTNPTPPQQPIAEQIAVNIKRAIGNGADRINIQLRPQELGRVDVKMEVASDGRVLAVVSVDRPDTLELLQRDQRSLQDALNQAGLTADQDSLSFNLKGENGTSQDGQADSRHADRSGDSDVGIDDADDVQTHINIIRSDRIDVVL